MLNYEVNDAIRHLSDLGHGYQRQLCELASDSFLKKLQVLILGGCWGGKGGGEGSLGGMKTGRTRRSKSRAHQKPVR